MKIKSLGLKISLIVAFVITVLVVINVYSVSARSDALVTYLVTKQAEAANRAFAQELNNLQEAAQALAGMIAYSNNVITAILEENDVALRNALTHYGAEVDIISLTDANGIVLMRMHSDSRGDSIADQRGIATALSTGTGIRTIEKGTVAGLSTRGSAVIRDLDGNIIGAIVVGHDLANPKYVDDIKTISNSEVTLFDGNTRLSTTLVDAGGNRVVGTQLDNQVIIDAVLNQRNTYIMRTVLFGNDYYAYYSPLIIEGEVIGMLFTGVFIGDALASQQSMMNWVLMAGVICGVVGIAIIVVFSILAVSGPLKKIGAFAGKIKSGDLGISSSSASTIDVRSADEVGVLARSLEHAYSQLQGYVGEIKERMQDLAEGDLTKESTYDFQGDFVLIKDSINGIINNLNETMAEINSSSAQVSSGANQVADGAQSLAQGATEQAATVEELSASIAEIAEKTKNNATMAGHTATLANTIMQNAEKGSSQMDEMMSAVREISQASQSISKVIKVIDDIAFQTNILALNAAVEAARAGQHGKGFAVVAEEVRNLAAKSAEAAKDTGGLIASSVEKADLGARIASETAASLTNIVSGINESNRLVSDIARSSEEQSTGILQVNEGIGQVAQVVQQNSATAEESAAAAEEMSGQSAMLQQLIARFKLKNRGAMAQNRSPAFKAPAARSNATKFALNNESEKY